MTAFLPRLGMLGASLKHDGVELPRLRITVSAR